jgi:DNA-binding transcriptional LysR family regulator
LLGPITEIAKSLPELRVELREDMTEKLVDLLLRGEINAALVGDVQDTPARIDEWPLFEERYVALLASSHQFANRPIVTVSDLRETIILERIGCDVARRLQGASFPTETPPTGHASDHDFHLQQMAAAGFGIMLSPEHMPYLPSLKALPIEGDPVWRQVRLLAVQGRHYSPALDAFVKVLRLRNWAVEAIPVRHAQYPKCREIAGAV